MDVLARVFMTNAMTSSISVRNYFSLDMDVTRLGRENYCVIWLMTQPLSMILTALCVCCTDFVTK